MRSKSVMSRSRNRNAALISLVALSLTLGGCSGSFSIGTSDTSPTASATGSATPSETTVAFEKVDGGEYFANDAQRLLDVRSEDTEILLPSGVVSKVAVDGENAKIKFTPFADKAGWEFEVPDSKGNNSGVKTTLVRWEGKTYVIADIFVTTENEGTGIAKDTKSRINHSYVLDAATGAKVNVVSVKLPAGVESTEVFLHDTSEAAQNEPEKVFTEGMIFTKLYEGKQVINPVSGKVAKEIPEAETSLYDFNSYRTAVASVGNYVIAANDNGRTVLTVNSITGEKFETPCVVDRESGDSYPIVVSPDFRYINVGRFFTLDTKTNSASCTAGTDSTEPVSVIGIGNDGTLSGSIRHDKNAIVTMPLGKPTEAKVVPGGADAPIMISDEGAGVFAGEDGNYIVVPKK